MRHSILAILVLMIMRPIHGYIDLFLNSNETSSILGYTGSFFYLFNGELRLNSIKHRLEIPFERNFVELTWKTSSPKIQVDYKISQIKPLPPPLTAPIFKMSINSTGNVPNSLSTFRLEFLCNHHDANHTSSYIVDYVDLTLEYYFALNDKKQSLSSALTDFQLLAMPAINFTMSYRKFCTDSVLISPVSKDRSLSSPNNRRSSGSSSSSSSSSSFILAYVIIAILVASVILIGLAYVYYTALNKKRRRELLRTSTHNLEAAAAAVAGSKSKYESFPGVRQPTKIYYEQQQQPLTVRSHPRPAFVKSSSASSGVAVVAAAASQARRVGSRPSTHRQPLDANNSSSNIYETVPDQSIVSQQPTATTTTIEAIATKSNGVGGGYKSLNVTANTIVSNYNNASVVTTATTATAITGGSGWTRRLNPGQVEKCKKFASDQIDLGSVIMEGTYSRIYEATITFSRDSIYTNDDQDDDNETEGTMENDEDDEAATITSKSASSSKVVRVLVKSVNERATREQTERMLIESAMLRGLKHKNINAIMGISICDDVSMSIFPASQLGNLKTFLIEHRPNKRRLSKSNSDESTDQVVALTLQDILFMILQLLKGVNFLHQKHIIHRDIAARNCWLDKGLKLKLADFALSRDMFPNDYHCVADNENRPVHWMSLETLRSNVYTSRSDIWTLGVAIWECFAFGAQPYDQVDPFKFADYLAEDEAQNRLVNPLPANCPQQVYEVVERCWRSNPSDRPSLKELFNSFHQFYNSLKTYV